VLYNTGISSSSGEVASLSIAELDAMLQNNPQGTLILTADLAEMGRLAHALSTAPPDAYFGALPSDARAFNALCAYPPTRALGHYRNIVFSGMPEGYSAVEGAAVYWLSSSPPAWLGTLPNLDEMREVYKALRKLHARPIRHDTFRELAHLMTSATGLSGVNCAASLLALHDMKLIELTLDQHPIGFKLNPMRKSDPMESAVWRTIQRWRASAIADRTVT
jgi:hypothetical protein